MWQVQKEAPFQRETQSQPHGHINRPTYTPAVGPLRAHSEGSAVSVCSLMFRCVVNKNEGFRGNLKQLYPHTFHMWLENCRLLLTPWGTGLMMSHFLGKSLLAGSKIWRLGKNQQIHAQKVPPVSIITLEGCQFQAPCPQSELLNCLQWNLRPPCALELSFNEVDLQNTLCQHYWNKTDKKSYLFTLSTSPLRLHTQRTETGDEVTAAVLSHTPVWSGNQQQSPHF